ncbi:uncharacterized protein EI90DRAFT_2052558 [Cantharellus anzutake]|uniref:uncharacterized protein n=1 Tax=Cantharellus anzutake TaxID=1750568 RepID=UPI001902F498|nr:uncharacterized protein EI90DRAFT_2052558 [Cantharellus anzutake]KAF8340352.1 hypothetical protein EI90DRAFT_2052558 [Cantharellus anzutake]
MKRERQQPSLNSCSIPSQGTSRPSLSNAWRSMCNLNSFCTKEPLLGMEPPAETSSENRAKGTNEGHEIKYDLCAPASAPQFSSGYPPCPLLGQVLVCLFSFSLHASAVRFGLRAFSSASAFWLGWLVGVEYSVLHWIRQLALVTLCELDPGCLRCLSLFGSCLVFVTSLLLFCWRFSAATLTCLHRYPPPAPSPPFLGGGCIYRLASNQEASTSCRGRRHAIRYAFAHAQDVHFFALLDGGGHGFLKTCPSGDSIMPWKNGIVGRQSQGP